MADMTPITISRVPMRWKLPPGQQLAARIVPAFGLAAGDTRAVYVILVDGEQQPISAAAMTPQETRLLIEGLRVMGRAAWPAESF